MVTLDFKVAGNKLARKDLNSLFAPLRNYGKCHFDFSADWNNLEPKVCQFDNGSAYYDVEIVNGDCTIPWEVLKKPCTLQITVAGGDLITTNAVRVNVYASGYDEDSGLAPTVASPSVYSYLVELSENIKADWQSCKSLLDTYKADIATAEQGIDIKVAEIDSKIKVAEKALNGVNATADDISNLYKSVQADIADFKTVYNNSLTEISTAKEQAVGSVNSAKDSAIDIINNMLINDEWVWSIDDKGMLKLKYDILNNVTVPVTIRGINVTNLDWASITNKITMRKLIIPDDLTVSNQCNLSNIKNVEEIVLGNKITKWTNTTIARNCPNLKKITFNAPMVSDFPRYAFMGCTLLQSIDIPEGVTQCFHGFTSCTSLTKVTFPSTMLEISYYSFTNCTSLQSINIPASVETIHSTAFAGCSKLKTITINKPQDSITGAPWGATNATVVWTGTEEV